jgi:hypothetical protein
MSRVSLVSVLLAVVLCAAAALPALPAAVSLAPALVVGIPSTSAMIGGPSVAVSPPPGLVGLFLTRAKDAAIEWVSKVLVVVFGTDEDGDDEGDDPAEPDGPTANAGVVMYPHG